MVWHDSLLIIIDKKLQAAYLKLYKPKL